VIDQQLIIKAVSTLRQGRLVAIPTETVYGLGADASNPSAVADVFAAKGRPADHPLIVHIATIDQLRNWARDIPESAIQLANAFWPGPLTMILKKQPNVLDSVTGAQDTIGLRIPNHPVALALLQAFGGGIAAPSANRFAHISPTSAAAVLEELGSKVDMILDGGDCQVGLESTIIDLSQPEPMILRPGMIGKDDIAAVLGMPVRQRIAEANNIRVPGMHHVHYAPITPMQVVATNQLLEVTNLASAVVTWSDVSLPETIHRVRMGNDATQYAHDLYHVLRELDHAGLKTIIVEAVPNTSDWEAIRDRLTKASAK
jgi:L-threonylcarbamoyladenylate synthase